MKVVEEDEPISRKTALTIDRAVRALNELGWVLNDTIRIAFFEGQPVILDLSTARPWNDPAHWRWYDDQSYVNSCFRRHGQDRLADLREAAGSIWFDTPLLERAKAAGWINARLCDRLRRLLVTAGSAVHLGAGRKAVQGMGAVAMPDRGRIRVQVRVGVGHSAASGSPPAHLRLKEKPHANVHD